jgi:hypothetical protein
VTPNAETVRVIDPPITELERELLRLIRPLDGGACLVGILLGDDKGLEHRLVEAMKQVAPTTQARSEP